MSVFLDARPATAGRPHPASLRLSAGPRRRPALLAGSAALLTACAALFASAYLKAGRQVPVLGISRPVAQGAVVRAEDLTVVRISASGRLAPVASAQAAQVVGRRAAVALVPGSLLTMRELTDAPALHPGQAVVGVSAKASQLPAEGVAAGETVDVVLTGAPGSPAITSGVAAAASAGATGATGVPGVTGTDGGGAAPAVLAGAVLTPGVLVTSTSAGTGASAGTTEVSLLVPSDVAPVIAAASAAGQVALVAVPPAS